MVTKALDIFLTSLVSWEGTLPAFKVREKALYQESGFWQRGQAGLWWQ